jgi:hypothetical protein
MPLTQSKHWYQSKALWAGVVAIVIAGYNAGAATFGWPEVPEFVYALLAALGVYGRAVANERLVK